MVVSAICRANSLLALPSWRLRCTVLATGGRRGGDDRFSLATAGDCYGGRRHHRYSQHRLSRKSAGRVVYNILVCSLSFAALAILPRGSCATLAVASAHVFLGEPAPGIHQWPGTVLRICADGSLQSAFRGSTR